MGKYIILIILVLALVPFSALAKDEAIAILSDDKASFNLTELKERPVSKEIIIQNNSSHLKELFVAVQKEETVSPLFDSLLIEIQKKRNEEILLKTFLGDLVQTKDNDKLPVITTILPQEKVSLWITVSIDPEKEIIKDEELNFNFVFGFLGNILEESASITPDIERLPTTSLNFSGKETALLATSINLQKENGFLARNLGPQSFTPSLFAEADRYFSFCNTYFIILVIVLTLILIYFYIRSKKIKKSGH